MGGDGGCKVCQVRAGTTSPMPDHKGFKLHLLVNFQKFSTLRVNIRNTALLDYTISEDVAHNKLEAIFTMSYDLYFDMIILPSINLLKISIPCVVGNYNTCMIASYSAKAQHWKPFM